MKRTFQPTTTVAATIKPLEGPKTSRWNLFYAYTAGTVMGLVFHRLIVGDINMLTIGMIIFSTVGVLLAVQTENNNRKLLLRSRTDKFRKN